MGRRPGIACPPEHVLAEGPQREDQRVGHLAEGLAVGIPGRLHDED